MRAQVTQTESSLLPHDVIMMSSFYQLSHTGRQDTDEVLMFQNSANIMDFVFDPFDNHRLVVGENSLWVM